MKIYLFVFLILTLSILSGCKSDQTNNQNNIQDNLYDEQTEDQDNSQYDNENILKWNNFPITYSINNSFICGDYEINRIRKAFDIIQNETNNTIYFKEVNNSANILITCVPEYVDGDSSGTYVSGEAEYNSEGNEIIEGSIFFYNMKPGRYTGGCYVFPDVEIHEILHTFAIPHSNNEDSIMYAVEGSTNICHSRNIDNETLDLLNSIYHFK